MYMSNNGNSWSDNSHHTIERRKKDKTNAALAQMCQGRHGQNNLDNLYACCDNLDNMRHASNAICEIDCDL